MEEARNCFGCNFDSALVIHESESRSEGEVGRLRKGRGGGGDLPVLVAWSCMRT